MRSQLVPDSFLQIPREILFRHEPYRSMSAQEIGMRVDMPAQFGRLQLWNLPDGHQITFTWTRPRRRRTYEILATGHIPDYDFWEDFHDAAPLWIVDMAATPGVSGTTVGRFLSWVLVEEDIAKAGEVVYFRRNRGATPGRFGRAIARG